MTISGIALFLLMLQAPVPQQPAAPAAPASIEGTVARALTGESLSKVTVTLTEIRSPANTAAQLQTAGISTSSQEYTILIAQLGRSGATQVVTTTSDGRFLFENLKPGTYSLRATLGGYSTAEYGQRGPNGPGMAITLRAGQKLQGISLTMTPGGTITGHVVDSNGDPLSRAIVQAQKLVYQERGRALITVQAVPTDDRGEYRLFWLPPGKYYISAIPSDDRANTITAMVPTAGEANAALVARLSAGVYGSIRDAGIINGSASGARVTARTIANGEVIEEAAVPVFYPGALDVTAAAAIEVRPGGLTSGIDIATKFARVYRVRSRMISAATGQVTSASGEMVLHQRNATTAQVTRMTPAPNSSGFELAGVLPGSYYLFANGSEGPGRPVVGVQAIEVLAANLDNVVVSAMPPFTIEGRISTVGTISNTASNPQSYVVGIVPLLPGPVTGSSVAARRDNAFILPAAVAGDYRISVGTPPGTYVQSIRFGGQDVLRDGLHLDGPTTETLEIVVSPNAGRLEGNVSANRQKLANARVVLVPAPGLRQQTSLFQTVQSNAEGHFAFESIAPGSYKVFAWEDVEALAWFDADFMQTVESRGTDVLIREGAKESIEITVIP